MVVKKGDTVKVEYEGTFDDGTVFDSSKKHGQPLSFTVGSGQIIKGFDTGVLGMKKGQEKKITIPAEDAYGEKNPKLLQKVPKAALPKDREPQKGMVLVMTRQDGRNFQGVISDVSDAEVTVDLNHPLAGKTLHFTVKVVEISEAQ